MTRGGSLGVHVAKKGVFLRETGFGDKSSSRGWWSGRDTRSERDRGGARVRGYARCEG